MTRSLSAPSSKPSGGYQLWSWFFMRISGLVLLFLALGHLIIMHLINNVDTITYDFVANRYRFLFWRIYDGSLLILALIHGLNGAKILIDDYVHGPITHRVATALLWLVGGVFLAMGVAVLIFFKPGMRLAE